MRHFLDLKCKVFMVRHPKYSSSIIKPEDDVTNYTRSNEIANQAEGSCDDVTNHTQSNEIAGERSGNRI